MSSNWILVFAIVLFVDGSVFGIRTTARPNTSSGLKTMTTKSMKSLTKAPKIALKPLNIDTSSYHRIINSRYGPTYALDFIEERGEYIVQLNRLNGNRSQEWRLLYAEDGAYTIHNRFLDHGYAVAVVIERSAVKITMRRTVDDPKQRWYLAPFDQGTYRLYNEFIPSGFLDVKIDTQQVHLTRHGEQDIGQHWSFEDVGPAEDY